jgi:hypothetical protein
MADKVKAKQTTEDDVGKIEVGLCGLHVHVKITDADGHAVEVALLPDDAYEVAEKILKCYDVLTQQRGR